MTHGYRRYPHLHGNTVVFVADDDLWLGETSGGQAHRLTRGEETPRSPRFSPDGKHIAYVATTGGGHDLYVTDVDGNSRRLTWLSATRMHVSGWVDSDHVLLASAHETVSRGLTYLYSVSLGGYVRRLELGLAMDAAFGRKGTVVASPNFQGPESWKRYRGGMAVRLWVSPDGKEDWRRILPHEPASLAGPRWFGDRIIFTSDIGESGRCQAQLWSVTATGRDLKQHTFHSVEQGYVRDATTDGKGIVYHARGELYYMTSLEGRPELLDFRTAVSRPQPVFLSPHDRLETMAPDHGGDGSLVEWRGAAYFLTHRSGPARMLADAPGARIREPRLLGRSGKAIWATDPDGEDCLEIKAVDGDGSARRLAQGRVGRVLDLASNSAGSKVAIASHDGTIYLLDVARGSLKKIGRSPDGEATGFTFSPDGRYLVWREAIANEGTLGRLVGYDVAGDRPFTLTRGQFNDYAPAFSSDGKFLAFLSSRTIDPSYDELNFDLSFTNTVRPWLAPLSAEEPSPFGVSADGWQISEGDDGSGEEGAAKSGEKTEEAVTLDAEGFEDRLAVFPVPSGQYRELMAVRDGVVWTRSTSGSAVLGDGRVGTEEAKDLAEHFSFKQRKATVVVEACDAVAASGDGERLLVRCGDEAWVQSADAKPEDEDRINVDLTRLRREIDPAEEWRQMFDETTRLMGSHFWREDMDGVDWLGVVERYRRLLPRLATHDDLVDLLWETIGELNTSHAYVKPVGDVDAPRVGWLGAEFTRNSKRELVIQRILPGESSDPHARSPLRAAGVGAAPGDVILAIDGRPTSEAPHVGALLLGSAEKVVELTLARGRMKRRVAVVPVASEVPLRYHEWVRSNVTYVDRASRGRLGYVHVPDMVATGWAEFHRLIGEATQRDGVIVDVRFNNGGHTSELVIERLMRKVIAFTGGRHLEVGTYPRQGMRGPVVFVTNSFAGSDGDIVCLAAQEYGIGPVVGERSWGGVIGIDGRFQLVDGTEVTQPRYWIQFEKSGMRVENHGVDPDVVVEMTPADWESSKDPQLDAAIAQALDRLRRTPALAPRSLGAPRFGPRS
ncbi:S41 family peptidase [Tessaracoccus sp. OH4464_COT-324]|uniref:S41 family peptidase n=1 Tax=Tessaracoccus sp. OH4464_COT-324 TaxID=2491059 RepID=UPI000F6300BD|nr:S41 family peptidase [Tessaracoccus sp. OH4464_COT-324]RRD46890.1 peptidase S41 [Tessaracoccus sp. OH4464_COT-324]